MHTIKTKLCRRKFTHSDIVEYSLQNEVLLFLRIPEEMICFSFQHSTYAALFLTDLVAYCTKVTLFFSTRKYLRNVLMMLFWKKLHIWSLFLFSESYCLSLSFWLIWQTSQAHDEGRIFLLRFWVTVAWYFK